MTRAAAQRRRLTLALVQPQIEPKPLTTFSMPSSSDCSIVGCAVAVVGALVLAVASALSASFLSLASASLASALSASAAVAAGGVAAAASAAASAAGCTLTSSFAALAAAVSVFSAMVARRAGRCGKQAVARSLQRYFPRPLSSWRRLGHAPPSAWQVAASRSRLPPLAATAWGWRRAHVTHARRVGLFPDASQVAVNERKVRSQAGLVRTVRHGRASECGGAAAKTTLAAHAAPTILCSLSIPSVPCATLAPQQLAPRKPTTRPNPPLLLL